MRSACAALHRSIHPRTRSRTVITARYLSPWTSWQGVAGAACPLVTLWPTQSKAEKSIGCLCRTFSSPFLRWQGNHHVRHPARECVPVFAPWHQLYQAQPLAERQQHFHRAVHAGPLLAVLEPTGVEERPAAPLAREELMRQLPQGRNNFGPVRFKARRVETQL